ncbi:hypothetical protein FB567DRAFT_518219 [Paraphoma chrysanthemicola]|uniref:Mtf2-like C-terminal domain-containing protein n=1 Tax=Paraphoma chrysanthemicola TaxID=798071 RepID=A0A8K0W2G8_9PLEO|nr:hypothetical protein FB567DRAFT_518219 [Paraphoma chrysanthemicola]
MSLCLHIRRAFSRTQSRNLNTLLPFLYQTATIQQCPSATRPTTRRKIHTPSKPADDIPFADAHGDLPPVIENAHTKTTITGSERAAFEKLYKTFNTQGQGRKNDKNREHEELDQIADEYYEDDEDSSGKSLDKVFDAVLQGTVRAKRATSRTTPSEVTPAGTKRLTKEGAETSQNKKQLAMKAERDRVKKLRLEERDRVDRLLKNAQTDTQLWQTLEREVLDQIRTLDLDGTGSKSSLSKTKERSIPAQVARKGRTKTSTPEDKPKGPQTITVDKRILFPNYPHHLLTALIALRTNFPGSPLPLTILPTIKFLGRSSYALGATTLLYRHLLRTAWLQQASYTLIDNLLADMETNVIEFDSGILEVLEAIIKEYEMARSGRLGKEMQLVYGMEMWGEGVKKIKTWRNVVAERLGIKDEMAAKGIQWTERRIKDGTRKVQGFQARRAEEQVPLVEGVNGTPDSTFTSKQPATVADDIPFVDDSDVKFKSEDLVEEANDGLPENHTTDHIPEPPIKVLL